MLRTPLRPWRKNPLRWTNPDSAMSLTDAWTSVEEEQYHWYGFTYDDDETHGAVEIRVYADPEESVAVTVRNEDQARLWEQEGEHEHFGCCTAAYVKVDEDEDEDGEKKLPYMLWKADDLASGQYYIVIGVPEGKEGPAMYRIEMSGEGVSS